MKSVAVGLANGCRNGLSGNATSGRRTAEGRVGVASVPHTGAGRAGWQGDGRNRGIEVIADRADLVDDGSHDPRPSRPPRRDRRLRRRPEPRRRRPARGVRRRRPVPPGAPARRAGLHRVQTAGPDGGPVRSSSGLLLGTDLAVADVTGPIDTLVVAGGDGVTAAARRPRPRGGRSPRSPAGPVGSPRCAAARSCWPRRGCSTGARATTHWARCRELAERYPQVTRRSRPDLHPRRRRLHLRRRHRRHGPRPRARR